MYGERGYGMLEGLFVGDDGGMTGGRALRGEWVRHRLHRPRFLNVDVYAIRTAWRASAQGS